MRLPEHHILDFHQACLGRTLVFIELAGDITDLLLCLGDHNVLERVDAAAGLLDLIRHELTALFDLGELDQIR